MTILVTGATGNVGVHVVRELLDAGADVVAAVRSPDEAGVPEGARTVAFDFLDESTWAEAFAGVDRLFLMRPPPISNMERDMFPALDAAREAGVEHVVLLSLLGAEDNPVVPHRKIEVYIEEVGWDHTFLRPSFFMQNLSTTHRVDIRDHDEIYVPAGNGETSFIDTRDIAEVAAMALLAPAEHRNVAYPLTGSEALSYHEVADIFTDVLGREITYPKPGAIAFAWRMYRRGHPVAFVAVVTALYTVCRLGLADKVTDDLHRLLGREPTGMRQFVEDYREVWQKEGETKMRETA